MNDKTEENILKHLEARRQRNGTPSYVTPDYYEQKTCAEQGIDIDYSPIDSGNDPTVR